MYMYLHASSPFVVASIAYVLSYNKHVCVCASVQSLRAQANLFTDRKLWLLEIYSMNIIEHFMLFLYDNILGSEQGRKSK